MTRALLAVGVWIAIVLVALLLAGLDTSIQRQIVASEAAGVLPFLHYLFFVYSPFIVSGICAALFAPLVAYSLRDLITSWGYSHIVANIICIVVAATGAVLAYWGILVSWVALFR